MGRTSHSSPPHTDPPSATIEDRAKEGDPNSHHPANCKGRCVAGTSSYQSVFGPIESKNKKRLAEIEKEIDERNSELRADGNYSDTQNSTQLRDPDNWTDNTPAEYSGRDPIMKNLFSERDSLLAQNQQINEGQNTVNAVDSAKKGNYWGVAGLVANHVSERSILIIPTVEGGLIKGRAAKGSAVEPIGPKPAEVPVTGDGAPPTGGGGGLERGEPVSVATGEYVETWRDFVVP